MEINALKYSYHLLLFGKESKLPYPFYNLKYLESPARINFHFKYPLPIRKLISAVLRAYLKIRSYKAVLSITNLKKWNEAQLMKAQPNIIILHGIMHLPWVCNAVSKLNVPLILNFHEYYPLEFEDNEHWVKTIKPLYDDILKKYSSKASSFFVVCNSIIKSYENIGITNQILIRNSKPYYELKPTQNSEDNIRMIHHGICNASRRIDLTIECMKHLPKNFFLDLMLIPDSIVYPKLRELAKNDPRINFLAPVPTNDIPVFINAYDLGIFLLPPLNFNYLNALPNKLFEFIQARLAIVVSPNPEMKDLVEKYQLGVVSKDYSAEEFAKAILLASKNIDFYKRKSDEAARIINDSEEQKKILREVDRLCAV